MNMIDVAADAETYSEEPVVLVVERSRAKKAQPKKRAHLTHDQMVALAEASRPPQSWYDEDFSPLGKPQD